MTNKIIYAGRTFDHVDITSGNLHLENSLISEALAIDTLEAEVRSSDTTLEDFERGEELKYYHGNTLIGKFYVTDVRRVAVDLYNISATSAIGMMEEDNHFGGIYSGQIAGEAIASIIPASISYTITTKLSATKLYGWLPIGTRRDNLRKVLFAIGGSVQKDASGNLAIRPLADTVAGVIPKDRVFPGGSVERMTPATRVEVTEHQYIPGQETVTLYDGTAESGDIITFDEPMHSLEIAGGTITESGANYAKVSAGTITLTGRKYTHTMKVVTASPPARIQATAANVYTVEDETLVNLVNSGNVADRALAFFSLRERVTEDIAAGTERPGDIVQAPHPFGGIVQGGVEELDLNFGNFLRGNLTLRAGFVPSAPPGNLYEHMTILTGSGTWSVPEDCTKIRVVMIGGGNGGVNGEDGKGAGTLHGNTGLSQQAMPGGKGGAGGAAGTAGKVFEFTANVTQGTRFAYGCGAGGERNGGAGGETVFGQRTTANGKVLANGFTELTTGITYARSGIDGIAGGDGGAGGAAGAAGTKGGDSPNGNRGGYPSVGLRGTVYRFIDYNVDYGHWEAVGTYAVGGAGGCGASATGIGGDAHMPDVSHSNSLLNPCSLSGASPSRGSTPEDQDDEELYGNGGNGGHGGGGLGGSGGTTVTTSDSRVSYSFPSWALWRGGTGGAGGAGGPGCVIVYY